MENPYFDSHFTFDFWLWLDKEQIFFKAFFISCRGIKGRTAELHCLLRRRRPAASYLNFANLKSNINEHFQNPLQIPLFNYALQFWQKKLSKNVWVLPSLFCLCFLVNSKKQFHPFELLGHKVDTEVTVKFETASDFDQEWKSGRDSMFNDKSCICFRFLALRIFRRTTTILVLPCRLLFTVVGSGDRQAKWRNCHRCISSPAEHSRQRYQKINFLNLRMHFPQKLVKWYCFSILILCFREFDGLYQHK